MKRTPHLSTVSSSTPPPRGTSARQLQQQLLVHLTGGAPVRYFRFGGRLLRGCGIAPGEFKAGDWLALDPEWPARVGDVVLIQTCRESGPRDPAGGVARDEALLRLTPEILERWNPERQTLVGTVVGVVRSLQVWDFAPLEELT